jgi:D-alanine-D-alanine ligase
MDVRGKRIGVLLGGSHAGREASLRSGEAAMAALGRLGARAVAIYADHDLDLGLRQEQVELAFVALHGRGADGPVQGLLESLAIPFTGSSLQAAALAADKLKAKEVLRLHNLPTPAYYCHARGLGTAEEQHGGFGYPCVVKPRAGGSGLGVGLARDVDELEAAVECGLRFDDELLVERHAAGRELQVAILDGRVLGVAEVSAPGGMLDWAARARGRAQATVPPRIGPERLRGVITCAVRASHLFGCDGPTRVDLIVSERGNESILEVEPFPELGEGAIFPQIAASAGLGFDELIAEVAGGARLHAGRRMRERREIEGAWAGADRRVPGSAESH